LEINRSPPEAFSETRHQGILRQAVGDYSADKAQTRRVLHNKAAWQAEACLAARQPRRNRQVEVYSEAQQSLQLPAVDCSETQAHSRQELPVEVYSVPPTSSNRIRLAAAVCSEGTRELRLNLKQNHFLARLQLLQEQVFCKHQLCSTVDDLWFADFPPVVTLRMLLSNSNNNNNNNNNNNRNLHFLSSDLRIQPPNNHKQQQQLKELSCKASE
jgi:hypothetical protein